MKVNSELDKILKELMGDISTEREKHLREMFIEIITEQELNKNNYER
jgi:hypothetical protein